jgi:hypothetical protein
VGREEPLPLPFLSRDKKFNNTLEEGEHPPCTRARCVTGSHVNKTTAVDVGRSSMKDWVGKRRERLRESG